MKKFSVLAAFVITLILSTVVLAADPLIAIDFANGAGDVELVDAELVQDPTRGQVLKVNGMGQGSSRQSYGIFETTIFEDNSWEDGLTISMWIRTDVGSQTLMGTAPIFSFDIARIGYIAVTTSLESAINTDGNEPATGISPRCWNDPANVAGGMNATEEGVWQLLTVVYSQDGMKIYVDGELYSEPVINNCTMDDFLFQIEFCYALRLGSWLCDWWNYGDYEGMIDDVLVYNTALDEDEIADLYTSTKAEQTVFEKAPSLEDLYTVEYVAPVYSLDFSDASAVELVNAEIVDGALKVNGVGVPAEGESDGVSYGLVKTDLFANTDWTSGLTISMKVNAASESLNGMAPIYSFDIANQGYIGVVASLQSGINSDGNEDVGISPRIWNDPGQIGSCKSALTAGKWQTVTVTYTEGGMAIYLDGEVTVKPGLNGGTYADLAAQLQLVPSLRLGSWLCSWWNFGDFEGMIDDVVIYNKALNPLEVQNLVAGTYVSGDAAAEEPAAEEPAAEEPAAEEPAAEAPAAEEPAAEAPVVAAPQTFDAGVAAALAAIVSAGAAIVSKKRR